MDDRLLSEQEDTPKVIGDIFSLRKPKDAKAGMSSGLKSMARGVVGGAAGLIAAPVIGASQGGFVGFAKGVATGVASVVVLPVAGIGVGTVQIVRGVMNQPEALVESRKGKIWDQERRAWVEEPGDALAEYNPGAAQYRAARRRSAAEVDYYEVLQVARDASSDQIKRQYYILARRWHPDKNPDNPEAHQRFQQIGEAYQVLGSPELRERYDQHGSEGLDVPFMDSSEFFSMLFGSEQFEHFVGELVIATAAKSGGDITQQEMRRAQQARVERLAVDLNAMLKRYVAGDPGGFTIAVSGEAERLAAASFGETMLHTIGRIYETQADIYLGGFFDGAMAKMRQSKDSLRSQFAAASAALRVFQHQQKVEQWERERSAAAAAAAAARTGPASSSKSDRSEGSSSRHQQQQHHRDSSSGTSADATGAAFTRSRPRPGEGPTDAADAASTDANGYATADGPDASSSPPQASSSSRSAEDAARQRQMEEEGLPLVLEAMWAANVLDIQATLKRVCMKLLTDPAVNKQTHRLRAEALKEMGLLFQAARGPQRLSDSDAKSQLESAMQRVMEKRMGQEAGDYDDAS